MSIFSISALNKELMLCQVGALREAPLRCWRRAFIVAGMIALIFLASACSAIREEIEQPPASSASQVHFTDVTEEVGLDFQHGAFRWEVSGDAVAMMGGGLCWLDYNKDGWLDLYVVNSYAVEEAGRWEAEGGLPRNALYRNDNGHFSDVSSSSGTDLQMRGNGCVAADFNLDGWTDLYITTRQAPLLAILTPMAFRISLLPAMSTLITANLKQHKASPIPTSAVATNYSSTKALVRMGLPRFAK
jgi:hypothetical protein